MYVYVYEFSFCFEMIKNKAQKMLSHDTDNCMSSSNVIIHCVIITQAITANGKQSSIYS